jgi:ATPase family associated with various cellular activities (AAA)
MSASATTNSWTEMNHAHLVAEFARLKKILGLNDETAASWSSGHETRSDEDERFCPAINRLAQVFGLSSFERDLLLLCAGIEMDSEIARRCADAERGRSLVTFGFAMAVLGEPHWSALTPSRPLRRFRLIELAPNAGLTAAPLRIDERILHYLAGINLPDPLLQPFLGLVSAPRLIADKHRSVAHAAAEVLAGDVRLQSLVHLCGNDSHGQEDICFLATQANGHHLFALNSEDLPSAQQDLNHLVSLLERESLLLPAAFLIECGTGGFTSSARFLAEKLAAPVFLATRNPVQLQRSFVRFDLDKPSAVEQKKLWQAALGDAAAPIASVLDDLAENFRLSARMIANTATLAVSSGGGAAPQNLWKACRSLSRPRLEDLAQRIVPCAAWEDLVLPDMQMQVLRQLAAQVRHRMKVHETWGFSAKGRRGLGVSALFCGDSGTGKTMAAEVLAHDLDLDLYRIDLASVVSKYIGETEKNLKQVFDAAEDGGVLLLFDEADALFGKRGEVRDSHDRYANIEVGYLLQRMESYQGLAILTTNLKSSLDRAFQRRLRFTVTFPFPDAAQREAIWGKVFPTATPTGGLNTKKLSQLNVTGGSIRNIALNAAFFAADEGSPVEMTHLMEAARLEAHKIERALSEAETRGWV